MQTINNVTIGDKFKYNNHSIAEVVDFHEVKSLKTGEHIKYICIAKGVNTLATNEFDTHFSTVVRNRIN